MKTMYLTVTRASSGIANLTTMANKMKIDNKINFVTGEVVGKLNMQFAKITKSENCQSRWNLIKTDEF